MISVIITDDQKQQAWRQLKNLLKELPEDSAGKPICPYCASGGGQNRTSALQYNENSGGRPMIYCHRCHQKADAITLYEYLNNVEFSAAVLALIGEAMPSDAPGRTQKPARSAEGKTMRQKPERTPGAAPERAPAPSGAPQEACEDSEAEEKKRMATRARFFNISRAALAEGEAGEAGRQYLAARQVSREAAKAFGLGYSDKYQTIVIPTLSPGSYVARSISAGAAHDGEAASQSNRYNVIGKKDITAPSEAELSKQILFATEGIFDALALWRGVNECCGRLAEISGFCSLNSVTTAPKLMQRLAVLDPSRRPGLLVICMDNDSAGAEAAAKLEISAREIDIEPRIITIRGYKDAGEAAEAGAMRAIQEAILSIIDSEAAPAPSDAPQEA